MDANFLKAYADRCRSLAENADEFTKRRSRQTTISGLRLLDPQQLRALWKHRSISQKRQRKTECHFEGEKSTGAVRLRRDGKVAG
jgi:hypothetical protein